MENGGDFESGNIEQNHFEITEPLEIIPEEEAELTEEELEKAQKNLTNGVKPTGKKYRISEKDLNRVTKKNNLTLPGVFTETKNGIPPQFWLVPLNNGAFLMASLIPGLNIIFLPTLLTNLMLLIMSSKKKQENTISSNPSRNSNDIPKNEEKSEDTPIEKPKENSEKVKNSTQNFGTSEVSEQKSIKTPAVSGPNFGTSEVSGPNFGTSEISEQKSIKTPTVSGPNFGTSEISEQKSIKTSEVSGSNFGESFRQNRSLQSDIKSYNGANQNKKVVGKYTDNIINGTTIICTIPQIQQ